MDEKKTLIDRITEYGFLFIVGAILITIIISSYNSYFNYCKNNPLSDKCECAEYKNIFITNNTRRTEHCFGFPSELYTEEEFSKYAQDIEVNAYNNANISDHGIFYRYIFNYEDTAYFCVAFTGDVINITFMNQTASHVNHTSMLDKVKTCVKIRRK